LPGFCAKSPVAPGQGWIAWNHYPSHQALKLVPKTPKAQSRGICSQGQEALSEGHGMKRLEPGSVDARTLRNLGVFYSHLLPFLDGLYICPDP
jgi:hypothetical protein